MPRQRSEERDKAFKIYKEHNGKIANREIARQLGIPEKSISGWKVKDKWDTQLNGVLQKNKRSTPKKINKGGAPKSNKNAVGHGAPHKNTNAERHGFFSRIFPDDPETMAIVNSIETKNPLDIIWENIVIQYTAIARAQRIMYVKNQEDMTKERSGSSFGERSDSVTYTIQFAWDKQASFMQAQSRAIKTLEGLIGRYEDMIEKYEHKGLLVEEHRLRIEKIKSDMASDRERLKLDQQRFEHEKIKSGDSDPETTDDGFVQALEGKTREVWGIEEQGHEEE